MRQLFRFYGLLPFNCMLLLLKLIKREIVIDGGVKFSNAFIYVSNGGFFQAGRNLVLADGMLNPTSRTGCKIIVGPNAKLVIGRNVGMSGTSIGCYSTIQIGDNCVIGGGVTIIDTDFHSSDYEERRVDGGIVKKAPIVISDDVFIGSNVFVLKGVFIGKGSIIGAGSVVTRDVPSMEVWAGNPCVFVRKI